MDDCTHIPLLSYFFFFFFLFDFFIQVYKSNYAVCSPSVVLLLFIQTIGGFPNVLYSTQHIYIKWDEMNDGISFNMTIIYSAHNSLYIFSLNSSNVVHKRVSLGRVFHSVAP